MMAIVQLIITYPTRIYCWTFTFDQIVYEQRMPNHNPNWVQSGTSMTPVKLTLNVRRLVSAREFHYLVHVRLAHYIACLHKRLLLSQFNIDDARSWWRPQRWASSLCTPLQFTLMHCSGCLSRWASLNALTSANSCFHCSTCHVLATLIVELL